ncbi:MAG: hypothetical protein LBI91_00780 [Spirochaetaceae bacterium]|jgi:hypothetical protein|nr:hypothetical protein [Spirochaetaceae bacterium]
MNYVENFLDDVIEDITFLRMRLINRLNDARKDLEIMRKSQNLPAHYQEQMDLVEQMNLARIHLYVAGEYLRGNGEWATLKDEEGELPAYVNQKGA